MASAADDCDCPELNYFAVRGRGEVIRIALSVALGGTAGKWRETPVDQPAMRAAAGTAAYPFGQAPCLSHKGLRLAQTDAIVRYIAREWGLYGGDHADAALVDMVLLGVEDVRKAYLKLAYADRFEAAAVAAFVEKHLSAGGVTAKNGGVHLAYLEGLLTRSAAAGRHAVAAGGSGGGGGGGGGGGFLCGGGELLSVADIALFDMVDLLVRPAMGCAEALRAGFPALAALHAKVAALPPVAAYLASPARLEKVNGNGLG